LVTHADLGGELRTRGPRGSGPASRYVHKSMESARYVGCDHRVIREKGVFIPDLFCAI
jgi:hypothetical protein